MKRTARARGFTLIELLVVIAIIGLLVAMLVPTLGKAREYGKQVNCLANLKAIASATAMYGTTANSRPPMLVNKRREMAPVADANGTAKENYRRRWWSGVLVDKGMLPSRGVRCPNPLGYSGVKTEGISPMLFKGDPNDQKVWAPPPITQGLSNWYSVEEPYDYVLSFSLVITGTNLGGPTGGSVERPTVDNSGMPAKTVLAQEWNWRVDLSWIDDLTNISGWPYYGPGHFCAQAGRNDWGVIGSGSGGIRMTRHIGSSFGTNCFAFADGHAAPIEMKWGNPGAILRETFMPSGVRPWDLYPDIAFGAQNGGRFAWMKPYNR